MRTATEPAVSHAPTPETLVARFRTTGDPKALAALFDATAPSLFRVSLSLVHDAVTAEDCLQEAYLAALEHLDRYDGERPFVPWLVGILRMMCLRARRDGHRAPDPVRVAAAHGTDSEDDEPAEKGEDAQRVRAAIEGLEEPYRAVALLRWRYGLSPAEIADVRGEPPGTVRSLLSRATAKLREILRGAPAFFLLPRGTRGLESVREAFLKKAASIAAPSTAAAPGATGSAGMSSWSWSSLSSAPVFVKAGVAAAVLALAGVAVLVAQSLGRGASGNSSTAGRGATPPGVERASDPATSHGEPPTAGAPVVAPSTPVEPPRNPSAPDRDDANPVPSKDPSPKDPPLAALPGGARPLAPTHEPEDAPREKPDAPVVAADGSTPSPVGGIPSAPPPDAGADGVSRSLAQRVDGAITKGVAWLKSRQFQDGSWGIVEGNAAYGGGKPSGANNAYGHPAGPTALALYALVKSGMSLDDPSVKRGFAFLRSRYRVPQGSYELSALLLAVTATADPFHDRKPGDADEKPAFPTSELRAWAQKLHDALIEKRAAAKTLGWRYMVDAKPPPGGNQDLSCTQLAAVALFAAERCGIRTEAKVWSDLLQFALKQQEPSGPAHPRAVVVAEPAAKDAPRRPDGTTTSGSGTSSGEPATDHARGFAYILDASLSPDEGQATGGMTACGLGTIEIARTMLAEKQGLSAKSSFATDAEARRGIFDGLAWLELHWSPFENPGKKSDNVYHVAYLYSVERAFDLLGNRRVGKHLWYPEMAEQLLARQSEKGFWESESAHKPREVLDTSFALLFLRRATGILAHDPVLTEPAETPSTELRGR